MFSHPHADPAAPPLFFSCGTCGNALEAPASCAGVEAPCPLCGASVCAPAAPRDPAELTLDSSFWDDPPAPPLPAEDLEIAMLSAKTSPASPVPVPPPLRFPSREHPAPHSPGALPAVQHPASLTPLPLPSPTAEQDAAADDADDADDDDDDEKAERKVPLEEPLGDPSRVGATRRRARRRLQLLDAGLLLLFLGVAAMAGAAIVFKEGRDKSQPPSKPPTLTADHFALMRDMEERRRQSLDDARQTLQLLLAAPDAVAVSQVLMPGSARAPELPFPVFPGKEAGNFEFISAERLPGTERFLSLFELAGARPVMVMVEDTAAGSRIHGDALDQQLNHRLETLLANPGEGEGMFHLRLRPTPEAQAADFGQKRPDLESWVKVDAESAFPIEGPSAFIACIAPGSPALDVLERRLHDPGFRPAIVRLAWRRHRETGPFLELVEFVPGAWSRH